MLKLIVVFLLGVHLNPLMARNFDLGNEENQDDDISTRDMDVPATRINPNDFGKLFDDGDSSLMLKALGRQKAAFRRRGLKGQLIIGKDQFSMKVLEHTIEHFESLWRAREKCLSSQEKDCQKTFETKMRNDFFWYRPLVSGNQDAHFTGYYSPTFFAKKKSRGRFKYGLYQLPKNSSDRRSTRNDILFRGALEGKGLELFYMDDPFELFLLHVEGGGVVKVSENGTTRDYFLSYAGTNGQKFSFIGGYMKDQGYIKDTSVKSQREFLKLNPDKWEEIYAQTPSYVFMKITRTEPLGMENIPLTPGRSMAQDRRIYWRKGLLGFVKAEIPDYRRRNQAGAKKELSRFFIDQDTGGAIRGEARADLYWGYGKEAQFLAEKMDDYGDLLFFVKK